jgi:hypothetical protein
MEEEQYLVRLDVKKLPNLKFAREHALKIAESLLQICGLIQIWDEPKHGRRIFYVRTKPQDVPQAGIHWIQVDDLPVMNWPLT